MKYPTKSVLLSAILRIKERNDKKVVQTALAT